MKANVFFKQTNFTVDCKIEKVTNYIISFSVVRNEETEKAIFSSLANVCNSVAVMQSVKEFYCIADIKNVEYRLI